MTKSTNFVLPTVGILIISFVMDLSLRIPYKDCIYLIPLNLAGVIITVTSEKCIHFLHGQIAERNFGERYQP